ncbi:hypothetical protein LTR49_001848 [Elasticomyces elasticus]|nr:hypothetical protein LTR49_001848 [Elasticomyces elasticus]
MAFIANWAIDKVQTTAAGYLKTGIQAGGNMAGNAVGGVGSLIENGGRSFGEGTVGGGIKGVGGYINSYGDGIKGSMAADGPVGSAQKRTAIKPSAVQPSTKNRITNWVMSRRRRRLLLGKHYLRQVAYQRPSLLCQRSTEHQDQ